jgi:hypothetical protein
MASTLDSLVKDYNTLEPGNKITRWVGDKKPDTEKSSLSKE